jgi:hypothetical protein
MTQRQYLFGCGERYFCARQQASLHVGGRRSTVSLSRSQVFLEDANIFLGAICQFLFACFYLDANGMGLFIQLTRGADGANHLQQRRRKGRRNRCHRAATWRGRSRGQATSKLLERIVPKRRIVLVCHGAVSSGLPSNSVR